MSLLLKAVFRCTLPNMTDFQFDIKERIADLKERNELTQKKTQFKKAYSKALVDPDWSGIENLDDFQTAFLDLLNQRYPSIFKDIQEPLEPRFYEMYQDSDDEAEKNYKPKDELIMHSIQVPSVESDEWQLMYEMNSDDTIFHAEFDGWTFKLIGVTH